MTRYLATTALQSGCVKPFTPLHVSRSDYYDQFGKAGTITVALEGNVASSITVAQVAGRVTVTATSR